MAWIILCGQAIAATQSCLIQLNMDHRPLAGHPHQLYNLNFRNSCMCQPQFTMMAVQEPYTEKKINIPFLYPQIQLLHMLQQCRSNRARPRMYRRSWARLNRAGETGIYIARLRGQAVQMHKAISNLLKSASAWLAPARVQTAAFNQEKCRG